MIAGIGCCPEHIALPEWRAASGAGEYSRTAGRPNLDYRGQFCTTRPLRRALPVRPVLTAARMLVRSIGGHKR